MSEDVFYSIVDKNVNLSADELSWASRLASEQFSRFSIEPVHVEHETCKTLFLGKMGEEKFLLYIRVTREEGEEDGTGAMPLVLLDEALRLKAEPLIVRVNIKPDGEYTNLRYWGIKELCYTIKSNSPEWRTQLLKGKNIGYFRQLVQGRINKIRLYVSSREKEILMKLHVDGCELPSVAIDIAELASSCYRDDKFFIFTCSCGEPGCADVFTPVTIASDQGLTLWKNYSLHPCRVYLFEQKQYVSEIHAGFKQFMKLFRELHVPQTANYKYEYAAADLPYYEQCLYEFEEQLVGCIDE